MLAKLTVIAGPDPDHVYTLNLSAGPANVGRSKLHAEHHFNDAQASRVHFSVELKDGKCILTDLSSSGTLVNGRKVSEHELKTGDTIRAGQTQMRFEKEGETATHEAMAGPSPGLPERLEELSGRKLGHFDVGPLLAKGTSGCVFKATDTKNNNQTVALKILWPEFSKNDEEMQRFIRAMKTILPLCHPNLIMLYGAGKAGNLCWISMEFADGENLTEIIKRVGKDGKLDWRYALRVAIHITRGLNYAEQQAVVHRNITPTNIIIRTADNSALLGDLMLAKALEGSLAANITKPGQLLGDVAYMSPERTKGTNDLDGRADIYSLGATVYALLTGKPPLEGISLMETIQKIRTEKPKPPRQYQPTLPEPFEAVVLKMLAKNPDDRPQTSAELLAQLERLAKMNGVAV
jgi:serine/threonine protein kinase